MDTSMIRETGIGGTVISFYLFFMYEFLPIDFDYRIQAALAVVPVLVILFLIDSLNDPIMKTIVGEEFLERTHSEIREKIGEKRFYYGHPEKQEKIDELDQKSVQKVVTIIGGFIVILTLPLVGYTKFGTSGATAALACDVFVAYLFIYRQYLGLRKIIKASVRLYAK